MGGEETTPPSRVEVSGDGLDKGGGGRLARRPLLVPGARLEAGGWPYFPFFPLCFPGGFFGPAFFAFSFFFFSALAFTSLWIVS